MLSDVQGEGGGGELGCWGVGECSGILDAQFLFFLLKKIENWICAMTKQHPNINRNFEKRCSFWLHCIVCGINRTIERVVNLNVTCCTCFGQCWTRGVGSRMFDNFHGRHMCILPYRLFSVTFHFGYCLRQLPRFIYLYIN